MCFSVHSVQWLLFFGSCCWLVCAMNICGASSAGQCVYAIISGNKLMELGERGCEEGQE